MGLLAVIAVVASACGVSRETSLETTPPTPTTAPQSETLATEPPAPPSIPDSLPLDPAGNAAVLTYADGSQVFVTNAEVIQADADFRGSATFINLVLQSGGVAIPIENVLIDQAILRASIAKMLDARDAEVTDAHIAQARDELAASLGPLLGPEGDGVKLLDNLGAYGDLVAGLQSELISLSETLPAPVLACVRHILVETEAEAQTAIDDINGGLEFSDVAIERSTGPSGPSGGDLGCASTSGYVPEFAAAVDTAEVGVVVGPVETQFGFHVIIVDAFEADAADAQNQVLAAQQLAEAELQNVTIEVDPLLGSWDPVSLRVIPA
jgi:hypothetical protein